MNNISKITLGILGALLIVGVATGASTVSAQGTMSNGHGAMIQRLAQRFNLNEGEIKTFFEEQRQAHMAEMKANVEQKLTQAVASGKITEAQKTAIIAKLSEMKEDRIDPETFKNMTDEQRQAHMEQKRTEMETWAQNNGLTIELLHSLIGGPGHRGFGMKMRAF